MAWFKNTIIILYETDEYPLWLYFHDFFQRNVNEINYLRKNKYTLRLNLILCGFCGIRYFKDTKDTKENRTNQNNKDKYFMEKFCDNVEN